MIGANMFDDCELDLPDSITTANKILDILFEASFDGICIVGNDEIVRSVNSAFVNIVDRSEKELVGISIRKIMPLEYHYHIDEWHKSDRKDKAEPLGIFYTTSKGIAKNLLINHTSMDIEGEITHFVFVKDITSHENIKTRLIEVEGNFNSAFEQAAIGMGFVNTEGHWLKVNNALCRILGYTEPEIIGMNFKSITYPDDLEKDLKFVDQMLKGTINTFESEKRYFRKDGEIIWAHISVSLVRNIKNEPLYFFSQTEDITERKKIETAILKERNQSQQYLDIAGVMIVVLDKKGAISLINKKGCQILGYEEDELLHKNWFDLCIHQDIRDKVWEVFIKLMASEVAPIEYFENNVITKLGDKRMIAFHNTVISNEQSGTEGILFSGEDITERKKAEEALIQAKILAEAGNRTKSELVANVSHELRTPLNSIIGFSEVLHDETSGSLNERQAKYVDHIYSSGKQLLNLINDLLDMSKIEAGKMELDYMNFSISTIINDVINLILPMSSNKDIIIETTIDEQMGFVRADIKKIKHVLLNLLDNTIKFTPTGGSVKIDVKHIGDMLKVAISDTGIGISKDDQKKLFRPFVQLDASTTREYNGTGLGLVIVKQIIELHGGEIWIESESGKGSTFIFTLPFNGLVKD